MNDRMRNGIDSWIRTSLAALLKSPKAGTGRAKARLTSRVSFSVLPKGLGMSEERGEDIFVFVY